MSDIDPALTGTILFYSAGLYPKFEAMTFGAAKAVAEAASEANQRQPLLMRNKKGAFPRVTLPILGEVSGPYAVAVMSAYLVWIQKKANLPIPDSPLLAAADNGYALWLMEGKPHA